MLVQWQQILVYCRGDCHRGGCTSITRTRTITSRRSRGHGHFAIATRNRTTGSVYVRAASLCDYHWVTTECAVIISW